MDSGIKLSFFTHSEQEIKAVALTYQYRSDFQKDHPGVYTSIFNRGLTESFFSHTVPKPRGRSESDKQQEKAEYEKLMVNFASYEELQAINPALLNKARALGVVLPPKTRARKRKIKVEVPEADYSFNGQTLDDVISLAQSYKNRVDFQKDHPALYYSIMAHCLVKKAFGQVPAHYAIPKIRIKEAVTAEVSRFTYLEDLYQYPRLAVRAKEYKIPLPPSKHEKTNDELLYEAIELIPKYTTLTNFKTTESVLAVALDKRGLYSQFIKLWDNHHSLTDEQIIEIAREYPSKTSLKYAKTLEKHGTNIWCAVAVRGLEDKAFAHMSNGYQKRWNSVIPKEVLAMSDKDIINNCLSYPNLTLWRFHSPLIARHAKKRKGLLANCLKLSQAKYGERVQYENLTLHPKVKRILKKLDIPFEHETKLLTGSRPDFTVSIKGRIYIIEVKSDRVQSDTQEVKAQLNRYHEQGKKKYGRKFARVILVSDHRLHEKLGSIKIKDLTVHLKKLTKAS